MTTADGDTGEGLRRRRARLEAETEIAPVEEMTRPSMRRVADTETAQADVDEGSTLVVRRESRRRAAAAAASAGEGEIESTVVTREPTHVSGRARAAAPRTRRQAQADAVYAPREPASVVIPAIEVPSTQPQQVVDTLAQEAARRRRARRFVALALSAALAVAVVAALALALLLQGA